MSRLEISVLTSANVAFLYPTSRNFMGSASVKLNKIIKFIEADPIKLPNKEGVYAGGLR